MIIGQMARLSGFEDLPESRTGVYGYEVGFGEVREELGRMGREEG